MRRHDVPAGGVVPLRTADFDYPLPADRIAQAPSTRREQARLLVLDRGSGATIHRAVSDLPDLLVPGDLLVLNDARVERARLLGRKETGGRAEVLLLERRASASTTEETWEAMVRASRRITPGLRLLFGEGLRGEVLGSSEDGAFLLRLSGPGDLSARRERAGVLPLPPYIRRPGGPLPEDESRYQTVYAESRGAVAAPTAGLHFTKRLLQELRERGVRTARLSLRIGPGTFRPVRVDDPRRHRMHAESFRLPEETATEVAEARRSGRRVVCVGTTTVRVLEACAREDGTVEPGEGRTGLFILPGHRFRAVDALVTNFHLPRSTLLMLVCAFAGRERILGAYREAVDRGYRFYSYGDAMFVT